MTRTFHSFISNLSFEVTEEEIKGKFSPLGAIKMIYLERNANGRLAGYGYVWKESTMV